jgi:hypothetical protein
LLCTTGEAIVEFVVLADLDFTGVFLVETFELFELFLYSSFLDFDYS